jgi:hypothetical protein
VILGDRVMNMDPFDAMDRSRRRRQEQRESEFLSSSTIVEEGKERSTATAQSSSMSLERVYSPWKLIKASSMTKQLEILCSKIAQLILILQQIS